jgi:hypothetical protein
MGSTHPCLVGRQLTTIIARAPTPRTFTIVSTTIHHGQWSGMSINIGGKEGHFFSNSLMIEMARGGV